MHFMKRSHRTVKNEIAKNIGLLHRAKQLLSTSSLKSIHTYLNYANIARASTQKPN